MNGKVNTPRTVCKAIIAVAIAAIAVAAIIGCSSLGGGSRRQNIATVIQTAYDMGGREMHLRRSRQVPRRATRGALRSKVTRGCAVSNKIESLVAEGKLTPSQAVRLHALAQLAYEGIVEDLNAGSGTATNATPASASQGGCTDCSLGTRSARRVRFPAGREPPQGAVTPDASADCGDCDYLCHLML